MEFITITETLDKIKNNKISVEELNEVFIKRIKEKEYLNSFIYFDEKNIQNQSRKIDNFKQDSALKGIPLAIKDLFCTKDMPTTAGSKILSNFQPTYESFVTKKLLNQES